MPFAPADHVPSGQRWVASPVIGVRVAGSTVDDLEALVCPATAAAVAEHVELSRWLQAEGAALSDLLYPVIGGLPDGGLKPRLVALRRALFQGRTPVTAWSVDVRAALPAAVAGRVDAWLPRLARAKEIEASLPELLAVESPGALAALRKAVAEPAFRFGLLLGSPGLADVIGDWTDRGRAPRKASLVRAVKYLARAAAKTSPNASFGFSGLGGWSTAGPDVATTSNLSWRGVAELDRYAVERLWELLAARTEPRDALRTRLNPSASVRDGRVRFLAATPGEPVTDVALTAVSRLVLELVRTGAEPTVRELVAHLERATSAPAERCRVYVDELVALGLVELARPFPDQSADPLADIVAWLDENAAEPLAGSMRAPLRNLRETVNGYPRLTDAGARSRRLDTIGSMVDDLFERLAPGAPNLRPVKDLVRENAVIETPVLGCRASRWRPALDDLDAVRAFLGILNPNLSAVAGAASAFLDRFGAGASVGFLDFYRELHAAADKPMPSQLRRLREEALRTLFDRPPRADGVIEVDPAELVETAASWPALARPPHSICCYAQEVDRADGPRLVVNAVRTGYSWGISRIHHLLGASGADVRPLGAPAVGPVLLAECLAALGTTLNVRSAAVPHVLGYPRVESSGGIPLSELVVGYNPVAERLVLYSAGGAEVRPLALGVLVEQLLPPALRYLVRVFGEPQTAFVPHVQLGEVGLGPATEGVRRRMRLEVGRVVLARAVVCVPVPVLPRRAKGETEAAFLLRFARWRDRYDIPRRCFVRPVGGRAWGKTHKPLYLDAANWLLLDVFDRSMRHLDDTEVVVFEEALPDPADAPRYGTHGQRVTEYIFEVSARA